MELKKSIEITNMSTAAASHGNTTQKSSRQSLEDNGSGSTRLDLALTLGAAACGGGAVMSYSKA